MSSIDKNTNNNNESEIHLTLDQNLFIRKPVPRKGIVCSNMERAKRIASEYLTNVETFSCSWGAQVWIGTYEKNRNDHTTDQTTQNTQPQQKVFVALAPVGSGSGLVFTELYSAGAEYLVRYGSDDVKNPKDYEYRNCVKVIDETDNLYGYCQASGLPREEWGRSVAASPVLLRNFEEEAEGRALTIERRICHHLENYHSLRNTGVYPNRAGVLEKQLRTLTENANGKQESFDMESAVLFRVAKDFGKHAISVLQTVNKEDSACDPYEGKHREQALKDETEIFVDYIFTALLRI